jgi:hypothetical protein
VTTTASQPAGWISEPTVEFFPDSEGRIESAYIALRRAKYASVVQLSPEYLVFLYVGADGLPTGIRLLEPAVGEMGAQVLRRLLQVEGHRPVGGDRSANGGADPMTLEQLQAVIQRMTEANLKLPTPSLG